MFFRILTTKTMFLVLDAYGRIPKGLTQKNSVDLGLFHQCINILENLNSISIRGKYCYSGLVIPLIPADQRVLQVNEIVSCSV